MDAEGDSEISSNTQKVLKQIESGSIKFKSSGKKDIHEVLITKHKY
jgi:hypothetical protein